MHKSSLIKGLVSKPVDTDEQIRTLVRKTIEYHLQFIEEVHKHGFTYDLEGLPREIMNSKIFNSLMDNCVKLSLNYYSPDEIKKEIGVVVEGFNATVFKAS